MVLNVSSPIPKPGRAEVLLRVVDSIIVIVFVPSRQLKSQEGACYCYSAVAVECFAKPQITRTGKPARQTQTYVANYQLV